MLLSIWTIVQRVNAHRNYLSATPDLDQIQLPQKILLKTKTIRSGNL